MSSYIIYTTYNCLLQTIKLLNFPLDNTYYLVINGSRVIDATINDGVIMFDFSKNRNKELTSWIQETVGCVEPSIENRHEYLNIDRIYSLRVESSVEVGEDISGIITLGGLFFINGEWTVMDGYVV